MSGSALRVENISKRYRLGELNTHRTLRESLTQAATRPLMAFKSATSGSGPSTTHRTIWALRDLSFDVDHGEIVGIIGRNGAGKSTLLKILSRITEPTSGRVVGHGRVGSLLEVGTGFHPELTGRENVYLNGAILGMVRAETRRKFDEIVAFAEVEAFLDTPVKRYSTGMYTRLAFAVAAHLEPDILLVDEVLAVGDLAFQKKCLGRMRDVSRHGRTVLFVSHNMAMIQALCSRTLWIDAGCMKADGPTADVVHRYQDATMGSAFVPVHERVDRDGDGTARIHSIRVEAADVRSSIRSSSRLRVAVEYVCDRPLANARFFVDIADLGGTVIYTLDSDSVAALPSVMPPRGVVTCETDEIRLTPGRCSVSVGLHTGGAVADWVDDVATFDVEAEDFYPTGVMHEREWTKCVIGQRWYAPNDDGNG